VKRLSVVAFVIPALGLDGTSGAGGADEILEADGKLLVNPSKSSSGLEEAPLIESRRAGSHLMSNTASVSPDRSSRQRGRE
jgi:hypothetical protein